MVLAADVLGSVSYSSPLPVFRGLRHHESLYLSKCSDFPCPRHHHTDVSNAQSGLNSVRCPLPVNRSGSEVVDVSPHDYDYFSISNHAPALKFPDTLHMTTLWEDSRLVSLSWYSFVTLPLSRGFAGRTATKTSAVSPWLSPCYPLLCQAPSSLIL